MSSLYVGTTLREERLRKQLSLEDVGRQTKISRRFLQAIESDDFQLLPGVVFTRNFVRQYADVLNLDPGPLLAALPSYDLETAPMPALRQRSSSRSVWDPRWNSGLASVAWAVLVCCAAVAAYIHFNRPVKTQMVRAAAVQAQARVPALTSFAPPAARSADPAATGDHPVQVVITAREDCWIQITSEGNTPFSGLLKASESKSFASDSPVKVRTGNAGGLGISLNGKELDPLGPDGQVRSVILTAAGPRFAPRNPPVLPDPL